MSPDADAGSSRSSVGSSTLNDAGAWNSNAFGRGCRAGVSGAGEPAAAGAVGSVAGVVDSAGGAVGIAGTVVTAAGADRLAPGIVAAGCGGATGDAADGAAETFDTGQLAGDEAGVAGVANVVASMAAGAEAIDGAGAAVVAPKDVSEPAGATGELEIGCAEGAAAAVIGAAAAEDVAVVAAGAGGTGRPAAGCDAIVPEGAKVPNVVPVDEADGVVGCVGAGAADGAATEPDTIFTGVVVAIVGALEPDAEAVGLAVDGVTAGATGDAGVEARGNEP